MSKQPLVSIIIPTYNRAHLIGETLDSVLAQTYQNWECIVVDDGSTDGTDTLLTTYRAKDSRFQYHHRPKERLPGGNAARNYGFEVSKGEYIIFLDSDDLLEFTCFENRVETVKYNRNEVCIFSMGLFRLGKKTKEVFNKDFNTEKEYLINFLKGNTPWTICSLFWNRQLFEDIGGFDENFKRLQDVDVHTRLLLKGVKVHRVYVIDTWYRILDDLKAYSSDEKKPLLIDSHLKYISKIYATNIIDEAWISREEIKNQLRILYMKTLKKYVFSEKMYQFTAVKQLNDKLHFFKGNKKKAFILLSFYYHFKLSPRFGYYRIRKYMFS